MDAGGDQNGRPRLLAAEQYMGHVQLGALHVDMIFDGFARRQCMPGDASTAHVYFPCFTCQTLENAARPAVTK